MDEKGKNNGEQVKAVEFNVESGRGCLGAVSGCRVFSVRIVVTSLAATPCAPSTRCYVPMNHLPLDTIQCPASRRRRCALETMTANLTISHLTVLTTTFSRVMHTVCFQSKAHIDRSSPSIVPTIALRSNRLDERDVISLQEDSSCKSQRIAILSKLT